jgi:uncharacterized protein YkwD
LGNSSTDGTLFSDRINELKATCRLIGENIYYGRGSPRDAIIDFVASDCDGSRTKRKEVFNTSYTKMGSCYSDHGHSFYKKIGVALYYGQDKSCDPDGPSGSDSSGSESDSKVQTDFDREFLIEHNNMRTNPMSFIADLERMVKEYGDNMWRLVQLNGVNTRMMSNEGSPAVTELIDFLKKQKGVQPIKLSDEIKPFSCAHVNDQGPAGATGHDSTNGDSFSKRVEGLMKPGQGVGENISYGTTKPREILIALAVDDGVPNRGHRTNIFKEDWQEMGSCYGPHNGYRDMAVAIYRGAVGSGASYDGVEPG